jgi:K+-sensing histidine kinase KdpD
VSASPSSLKMQFNRVVASDGQVSTHSDHSVRAVGRTRERILIAVRADSHAADLIRTGKRIAEQCGADWTALCVQTPTFARAGSEARVCPQPIFWPSRSVARW